MIFYILFFIVSTVQAIAPRNIPSQIGNSGNDLTNQLGYQTHVALRRVGELEKSIGDGVGQFGETGGRAAVELAESFGKTVRDVPNGIGEVVNGVVTGNRRGKREAVDQLSDLTPVQEYFVLFIVYKNFVQTGENFCAIHQVIKHLANRVPELHQYITIIAEILKAYFGTSHQFCENPADSADAIQNAIKEALKMYPN
ncbi:unnamed protein product [Caenorhabditis bovis]|uniref:Uncharacterized protein n=1 Tax=Caenorhabditis bovis TaxID=2654633 RepID=A0A8S1ES99_9PELO|nr:unnamed protein product [Caenorhabditis bovis]